MFKILFIILAILAIGAFINRRVGEQKVKPCTCGCTKFKNLNTLFVALESCTACKKQREACF